MGFPVYSRIPSEMNFMINHAKTGNHHFLSPRKSITSLRLVNIIVMYSSWQCNTSLTDDKTSYTITRCVIGNWFTFLCSFVCNLVFSYSTMLTYTVKCYSNTPKLKFVFGTQNILIQGILIIHITDSV